MAPKLALLAIALIAAAAFSLFAEQRTASATIHEIVASFCAAVDHDGPADPHNPPGLSRPGSKNFAQPLLATGVVQLVPVVGPDGPGLLADIDGDHPASKFDDGGDLVKVDELPNGTPIYFHSEMIPDHPAFEHCPNLSFAE